LGCEPVQIASTRPVFAAEIDRRHQWEEAPTLDSNATVASWMLNP